MTEGDLNPGDNPAAPRLGAGRLADFATAHTIRRQRRVWSRRVASWDQHGSANLHKVTAAVLAAASVHPGEQAVDLGCGNGQLSLPLAERGARVLAVDVSPGMVTAVLSEAARRGLDGVESVALPIENLTLPEGSADLIVSSYALHHLRDADKARLMDAALRWLRPGGRLVLADMMFGRGGSARDRQIIASKVAVLVRKGPGGWWRIAKNFARYQLRMQERPVSMAAWVSMMTSSGFADIATSTIVAEAGLITARRPGAAPHRRGTPAEPRPDQAWLTRARSAADQDHLERARAVHALDPLQLDVAGSGRAADPGQRAAGPAGQSRHRLGHQLDHLLGAHDAQVIVGHQGDGPAP